MKPLDAHPRQRPARPLAAQAVTPVGTQFDAVVIGAGPAGSTAAILLARAGWAVALVEKQRFPRRKVCGECIAASNLPLLEQLGLGPAFDAAGSPELCQVSFLRGPGLVSAALPAATAQQQRWGRALGRETLDALLLAQARSAGVEVLQPWSLQRVQGAAGSWYCKVRAVESSALIQLRAAVLIDAHGAWDALPGAGPTLQPTRGADELLAFKANFSGAAWPQGSIAVLALDGGYGGMVQADGGLMTLACCIRRDRLNALRCAAPGLRAGEAVQAWLQRDCAGVQQALQGATRVGAWLACGAIGPGVHVAAEDEFFKVGNAAGEAHPILGEGISMALQSAALLCGHLLGAVPAGQVPVASVQAQVQQAYAADWQGQFGPRLRLAALFAQAAQRPAWAALLMALLRAWPGLLTLGARWGGKVRQPRLPGGWLGPRPTVSGRVPGRPKAGMKGAAELRWPMR